MTATDILAEQLWREYRGLVSQDFRNSLASIAGDRPYAANPRIEQLRAWLMKHPPPGKPYRCRECLYGTHSEDRLCAACWAY